MDFAFLRLVFNLSAVLEKISLLISAVLCAVLKSISTVFKMTINIIGYVCGIACFHLFWVCGS